VNARDGGQTDGIAWARVSIGGKAVRIPYGVSQFGVLYVASKGVPPRWIVVRVDTLEICPADPSRSWLSAYDVLGTALLEAIERQEVWTALAIQMLGQANASASAGRPATLFEQRAYQKQHGVAMEQRKLRAPRVVKYPAP
jgi:hypothetical protein